MPLLKASIFSSCHAQRNETQRNETQRNERGNAPSLIAAILYFVKRKRFVGRRRIESPSSLCFMYQLRKSNKQEQQQIGQAR